MNLQLDILKAEQNAFCIDFIFYILNNNLDSIECINIKLKDIFDLSQQSNITLSLSELEMLLNIKYIFNNNKDFICASLFNLIKINKEAKTPEEQEISFFINASNFKYLKNYFQDEYGQISEKELKFYFALKSNFAKKMFKLILKQKKLNINSFKIKVYELLFYLSLDNYADNNAYRVVRNTVKALLDTTYIDNKKDRIYFENIILNRCKEKNEKIFEINFTIANENNEAIYKISVDDKKYINKILRLYHDPNFYTYSDKKKQYYRLYNYDKKIFIGKLYSISAIRETIFEDSDFSITTSIKTMKEVYEHILSHSFIRTTPKNNEKRAIPIINEMEKIDINKYLA